MIINIVLNLLKIAGNATEANDTSAVSEAISESLLSCLSDKLNIYFHYSKEVNDLSNFLYPPPFCKGGWGVLTHYPHF